MQAERIGDLVVFAKDYPEARLVLELKSGVSSPLEVDAAVKQVARYMWGANCHFGLIMTPTKTYVLRDDFTKSGPESIRVTDMLSTGTLLSRLGRSLSGPVSEQQLGSLARAWLEKLAASYETALPDDPDVTRALFPDIVGAVSGGRVVDEVAVR